MYFLSLATEGVAPAVAPTTAQAVPTGGPKWRCVYEFSARTVDELSLQPGDLVSSHFTIFYLSNNTE